MAHWKHARSLVALCVVLAAAACSSKSPSVESPTGPSGSLPAPAIDSPSDDQQLDTLRPTLVVRNSSSTQSGVRTYDFQVADNLAFSPIAFSKLSVVENASGKTTVAIDVDLQPSTRFYWRARMVQGGVASDWIIGKFRTKAGGYNRAGELFDILSDGFTVGERFGSTTFVPGKGLRIDTYQSYVRYQLPETVATGEFSMEVEGLGPNGPRGKQAIFAMAQGLGNVTNNSYEMFAQYRGADGNPANAITFKAVWGSTAYKLEFDFAGRSSAVMSLNPSTTYFWQGSWTPTAYRLVVKEGGVGGRTIYDRTIGAPGGGPYAPNPHVAYIGSNSAEVGDDGSFTGMVVRNVWLSGKPRPASLGSATGPSR